MFASLLLRCVASSQKTPNTGQSRIVRVSVRANGITRKQTHNILLLNYTILGHTRWFAASAYCVQYLSIACDAASGHTCTILRIAGEAASGGHTSFLLLLLIIIIIRLITFFVFFVVSHVWRERNGVLRCRARGVCARVQGRTRAAHKEDDARSGHTVLNPWSLPQVLSLQ